MATTNTKVQDIVFVFVFLFSFGFVPVYAAIRTSSFKRRGGCLINNSQIISTYAARSQLQCSVRATSFGHITSSWNAVAGLCTISDVDTTHDGVSSSACDWIPGWNTFTQKRYPVFDAVGPNGRNSLTYPQAVTLCQDYGTSLASLAGLLSAKELGFYLCKCGWLSDGSNRLVHKQPVQIGCPALASDGVVNCNFDLANAYCFLK